jgi:hypothetical protein
MVAVVAVVHTLLILVLAVQVAVVLVEMKVLN